MSLVSLEEIRAAAERISGLAVRTPLLPVPALGPSVSVKAENLQITGSFKIRGALNAAACLSVEQRAAGLVTYSSGNHGQALAFAARHYRVPGVIVMPDTARTVKIEGVRALGARAILVPAAERRQMAEELAAAEGLTLIPPYDHPQIVAGQGSIGLEILEQAAAPEVVLVPVGGGALASGVAVAVKTLNPRISVIGVEPALAADAAESLAAGHLVSWAPERSAQTVADGLRTNLAPLTFTHLSRYLDAIITVSEEEILQAVDLLLSRTHLVVEPSGAVTVAAYWQQREELAGRSVVAILSGGNLDRSMLRQIIAS